MEGPHDVDGYSAVAARRLRTGGIAPPSAYGMSLLAPPGSDGGKDRLPDLAKLATNLGFRVRVVLDHDKPGTDTELIAKLQGLAEAVIRLPERFAVERAIVYRLSENSIRTTLEWLSNEYALGIDVSQLAAADLYNSTVEALKKKGGLHQPWVDALPRGQFPPVALAVLDAVTDRSLSGGVLEEIPKPT